MKELMKQFGTKNHEHKYVDRPGAYAFIYNDKKELAMIQTPSGFFLPGGGIDKGETPTAALKREMREETAMSIKNLKKLDFTSSQFLYSDFERKAFNKMGVFFLAEFSKPLKVPAARDHTLVWMKPVAAIKNLKHEFQKWAVRQLIKNYG